MQSSAIHHAIQCSCRALGMAGIFVVICHSGVVHAVSLKLSMHLEFPAKAVKPETLGQSVAVKNRTDSPWYEGLTLGSIPAKLNSVKHFLTTIQPHESNTSYQRNHDAGSTPALAIYNKTANALGLIPYGVSYTLSRNLDIQYAGNSAAVGNGAPWQSLRMINKDDPNRHWYFALDKVQFERKDEISAGVGVLLPLR